MNDAKYIGLDVHQATISAAIQDAAGKLVAEAIIGLRQIRFQSFWAGCAAACNHAFQSILANSKVFEHSSTPNESHAV